MRFLHLLSAPILAAVSACTSGDPALPKPPVEVGTRVAIDPIRLEPGQEIVRRCQGFRLENDQPLYLERVLLTSSGAHHSDWFVLSELAGQGDPGPSGCDSFDRPEPGTEPGAYLFSQSTQARVEEQSFGDGAAIEIPARSQVMVSHHLLNTKRVAADAQLTAELFFASESTVTERLHGGGGDVGILSVPARSRSRLLAECSFVTPRSLKTYFMLPHYHELGTGMRLEILRGREAHTVWDSTGRIGEPLGGRIDPPIEVPDATGFRWTCSYDNPTEETMEHGILEGEMCVFYLHSNWPKEWYGTVGFFAPAHLVDHGTNDAGERVLEAQGCVVLEEE